MLALAIAATAGAQSAKPQGAEILAAPVSRVDSGKAPTDSSAAATKAAEALPQWF
ncbi:MAG: hypothetical protein QOK07_1190, partial [Gemmatimonadaceae bacterium]|nr:hypothetical protein [Gemmatimonadaceae bacterium]